MIIGKGVFVNVASPNTKSKLRVLYEVAPIGYLIEKAGGKTSEGEKSVLDIEITETEQVIIIVIIIIIVTSNYY